MIHKCGIYECDNDGNENYNKPTEYLVEELNSNISIGTYGQAIIVCIEDDQGRFIVGNGEYSTQVNFCPFCGQKAKKLIEKS